MNLHSLMLLAAVDTQAWVAAAFCFVLGAIIGSFLNVVVYRLPRGLSILRPGSRCPACGRPIRPIDNVPIAAWLRLRGRCRDCGAAISPRYPLVELATSLGFLALGVLEPIGGGRSLPESPLSDVQLWCLAAWHAALLSALLCAALMEQDGQRLPRKFTLPVFLAGLVFPSVWPLLHPVPPLATLPELLGEQAWAAGPLGAVAGLVVGLVLGCLASPITGEGPAGDAGRETAFDALAWTGLFLGWQAAAGVAVAATVAFSLAMMYKPGWKRLGRVPFAGCVLAAAAVWITNWGDIVARVPRFGLLANHVTLAAAGAIVLLASSVARLFRVKFDS